MEAQRIERRLAAILAADMVGFSRLMEADEAGTLGQLKALRAEIIDPRIDEHHGTHRQDHRRRPAGRVRECRRDRINATWY